jgi:hypothetical protein
LKTSEPLPAMQQCAARFFLNVAFHGFELTNAGLSIRLSQDIHRSSKARSNRPYRHLDSCEVEAASLKHFALIG